MSGELIIGGGPAGAMLAAGLAQRSHDVLLLERSGGPHHKICGEFLSWEGRAALRRAGVPFEALAGAGIDRLRIVIERGDGRAARRAETALPGTALGISRYRLDEILLDHAMRAGARVERGVHVRRLENGAALVDGRALDPSRRLWLATGKTDLPGARRQPQPGRTTDHLTGYKRHYRLAPAEAETIAHTIELHHFPGGYAGLQPIEEGRANLCLLVQPELSGTWDAVVEALAERAPSLHARLAAAAPLDERALTIARVPYGYVRSPGAAGPAARRRPAGGDPQLHRRRSFARDR